jgi:hypothetical protein
LDLTVWRANRGATLGATVELGASPRFSQQERQRAAKLILQQFKVGYAGCKLKRIYYDEAYCVRWGGTMLEQAKVDPDNLIVLRSDFSASASAAGGFTPNQDYDGWTWYLTRAKKGSPWKVYTCGYA